MSPRKTFAVASARLLTGMLTFSLAGRGRMTVVASIIILGMVQACGSAVKQQIADGICKT